MSNAPVCNVNLPPGTPPPSVSTNTIPVANATNIVQVVNMLRAAMAAQTNQNPGSAGQNGGVQISLGKDVTPPPRPNNNQNNPGQQNNQNNKSSFKQTSVVQKQFTITDPNSGASVVVNQIVGLTLTNPVSGETWVWTAPAGVPGGS